MMQNMAAQAAEPSHGSGSGVAGVSPLVDGHYAQAQRDAQASIDQKTLVKDTLNNLKIQDAVAPVKDPVAAVKDAMISPPIKAPKKKTGLSAVQINGGEFEAEKHFYPRVLNAHIHPLVASFFSLGNTRILTRYTHLNPQVNQDVLKNLLAYKPKYFQWAGSDLFNVTTPNGQRQMIIVETNSCPSGQKSMPLLTESEDEYGGYGMVIDSTFRGMLSKADASLGDLAVVYDKNPMEATGYASVLADLTGERVWMAEYYETDHDPPVKWDNGIMSVRDESTD